MEELQLAGIEQAEVTEWNFEDLKEELAKALSVDKTTVYIYDTIKLVKSEEDS